MPNLSYSKLQCPCFAMGISPIQWREGTRPVGAGQRPTGSCKGCFVHRGLVRLVADGAQREFLCIMVPILAFRPGSHLQSRTGHHLPCARSQIRTPYWDKLKNLVLAIEPPANPMRPTLRDGH